MLFEIFLKSAHLPRRGLFCPKFWPTCPPSLGVSIPLKIIPKSIQEPVKKQFCKVHAGSRIGNLNRLVHEPAESSIGIETCEPSLCQESGKIREKHGIQWFVRKLLKNRTFYILCTFSTKWKFKISRSSGKLQIMRFPKIRRCVATFTRTLDRIRQDSWSYL